MSSLTVYHQSSPDVPNKLLTHGEDIAATLRDIGVGFERWSVERPVQPGMAVEEVIAALQPQLDALMRGRDYAALEVHSQARARTYGDEPSTAGLEELHSVEAEGHLLVAGRGLFNLHVGDYVYAVQCEKNDLLSWPAGTRYWFDRGEFPHLVALSMRPQGRAAVPSGDDIAGRFPRLED